MCVQVAEPGGAAPRRALVLCANDDIRDPVIYWLSQTGFVVDAPQDGTRAARLLRKTKYEAFLTDRFLPPWPGLDVVPAFKRRYPKVRLVIVLHGAPVGMASLLRLAGADAVVDPPLRRAALLSAIEAR